MIEQLFYVFCVLLPGGGNFGPPGGGKTQRFTTAHLSLRLSQIGESLHCLLSSSYRSTYERSPYSTSKNIIDLHNNRNITSSTLDRMAEWVPGRLDHIGNEMADKLLTSEPSSQTQSPQQISHASRRPTLKTRFTNTPKRKRKEVGTAAPEAIPLRN